MRLNTIGKFSITDHFRTKDHKGVFIGYLVEGRVAIGNYISIPTSTGEIMLKIISLEKGQTIAGVHFIGMLVEVPNNFQVVKQTAVLIMDVNGAS